jgi:hypothetical protein
MLSAAILFSFVLFIIGIGLLSVGSTETKKRAAKIEDQIKEIRRLEKRLRDELEDVEVEPIAKELSEKLDSVYKEIGSIEDPVIQAESLRKVEQIIEDASQLEKLAREKMGINPFKKRR